MQSSLSVAEAVDWIVEDGGYTPLIARNGQEALELTRTQRPALMITDWMMPVLDGVGLIRALKQQAAQDGLQPIPTILMTAPAASPCRRQKPMSFCPSPLTWTISLRCCALIGGAGHLTVLASSGGWVPRPEVCLS